MIASRRGRAAAFIALWLFASIAAAYAALAVLGVFALRSTDGRQSPDV